MAESVELATILLTDLVGSTRLATSVGPVRADQLREEHFGLLRDALGACDGKEVKNTGDGLMVAFASASAAVKCAVSMQQLFERRYRHAEQGLHVRIGLGAGESTVKDGDYFGMPSIEAARLCGQAPSDGILVSRLAKTLAGRCEGVEFASAGELELKGFPEPVESFAVSWAPLGEEASAAGRWPLPAVLRSVPPVSYVGRVHERERLAELWGHAQEGSLRLAVIAGEAGVGKTRLSAQLALQVHGKGATVLYGRCDEDLGVPYQPWAQALGHLVNEAPQRLLDAHVERFGGDLARLISALRDRVPELPSPRESDPETERYLLYAAAEGLVQAAGEEESLLLILDDLHWADAPTLSLLRHVVTAGSSMRVMVVGTYRDSDLSRDHPLTALLADLHRERGRERIKLTGLDSQDVLALMEALAGHELDGDGQTLAAEITRETAGNPFFAVELLRHLTESGAIAQQADESWHVVADLAELGLPQSVREVIGRRVERLGPDAHTALSAAAVIGRDFDLDLLLGVLDLPEAQLLDLLDEAVTASLLNENRNRAGRFTFTHALVEHALYEDLGTTRRVRLHRQVAEALEKQCGDEPGERLGELAAHWAAATVSADAAKAIHYARRAGQRALEQLAPDEAVRWYRQALELQDLAPGGDRSERCDLLIGLGEAQRQIGNPDFRQTLLDAASLAQQLDDTDRLCRAVLANTRGFTSKIGAVDYERVHALESAAGTLLDDDQRRAQVLALLACEVHFAGDSARCHALAEEAIELARAAGDPSALAYTLINAIWAISVPATLKERQQLGDELVELAERLGDPWLSFWANVRSVGISTDAGDRSRVESSLPRMRALDASVPQPSIAWLRRMYDCGWALVQGDLQAAEQWAIQTFEVATTSGEPDAMMIFGGQLFNLRYFEGRAGELVEPAVQFAGEPESVSSWQAVAALALIESGRLDEARARALAEDFQSVPRDLTWTLAMFQWTDACCRLGIVDRAGELYELLAPFSSQIASAAGVIAYGSIARALGALATILERYEQAESHFAAAAEIEESLGAPLFLARTRAGWASSLIARGRTEDLDRVRLMLEQAGETAGRLGGGLVTREVAECRAALAAVSA